MLAGIRIAGPALLECSDLLVLQYAAAQCRRGMMDSSAHSRYEVGDGVTMVRPDWRLTRDSDLVVISTGFPRN